jgi:DNA polymerase-3 subunit alpha
VSIAGLHSGERNDGDIVSVAGLVSAVQRKVTKKGASWAMITLEDLDGAIEVLAFPQIYASIGTLVVEDAVLAMRCKVEQREGEAVSLVALEAEAPDIGVTQSGPILVRIPVNKCVPPVIERFQEVLAAHPGTIEVRMHVVESAKVTVMRLDEKLRVNPSSALYSDLKALLGPNCLTGVG